MPSTSQQHGHDNFSSHTFLQTLLRPAKNIYTGAMQFTTLTVVAFISSLAQADWPGNCPTQGPGQCLFMLSGAQGPLADVDFYCYAFDSNCKLISDANPGNCDPGTRVGTYGDQYLTVYSRGGGGSSQYATIEYQGHTYNDVTNKDCSSGLTGCTHSFIGFPC